MTYNSKDIQLSIGGEVIQGTTPDTWLTGYSPWWREAGYREDVTLIECRTKGGTQISFWLKSDSLSLEQLRGLDPLGENLLTVEGVE